MTSRFYSLYVCECLGYSTVLDLEFATFKHCVYSEGQSFSPDSSYWFQVTLAIFSHEHQKYVVFAWWDTITFLNKTGEQQPENA